MHLLLSGNDACGHFADFLQGSRVRHCVFLNFLASSTTTDFLLTTYKGALLLRIVACRSKHERVSYLRARCRDDALLHFFHLLLLLRAQFILSLIVIAASAGRIAVGLVRVLDSAAHDEGILKWASLEHGHPPIDRHITVLHAMLVAENADPVLIYEECRVELRCPVGVGLRRGLIFNLRQQRAIDHLLQVLNQILVHHTPRMELLGAANVIAAGDETLFRGAHLALAFNVAKLVEHCAVEVDDVALGPHIFKLYLRDPIHALHVDPLALEGLDH